MVVWYFHLVFTPLPSFILVLYQPALGIMRGWMLISLGLPN